MNIEKIARSAITELKKEYPNAGCSLNYKSALQLLIATRLSAQCTDARVNMITPALFDRYKSLEDFANADILEIEKYIRPCGFYHVKAADIVNMCKILTKERHGKVPSTIEELTKLPGVGRKTANLIVGDIYGKPSVVVDTHCMRVTKRLGLHSSKNPLIIERILKELLPKEESTDFCHRLVLHGRAICKATSPKCEECCMNNFCKYWGESF